MSQSRRAMVECIFGWGEQNGTIRKTKHPGIAPVAPDFLLDLIALIRISQTSHPASAGTEIRPEN
jgi:hypothetical protein